MKEKEPIEIQALQELLKGSTLLKAGRSVDILFLFCFFVFCCLFLLFFKGTK